MPKIIVQKSVNKAAQETFEKLKTFLSSDPDLKRMDSSYQCQFQDEQMTGTAKGTKFNALLNVKQNGTNSDIEIQIDLPLMMTPFKGVVESTIQNKLNKLLG